MKHQYTETDRYTVVRLPVLQACFPYPCARQTAGRVTTLWVKRQRLGRCPSLCVQAVSGGLVGRRLRLVTRAHLRWLDCRPSACTKMRYTNRWPYLTLQT